MKSSFGRSFSSVAFILLLALTLLGASFQVLVKNFLTQTVYKDLLQDASILAGLASTYNIDSSLSSQEFRLNLNIVQQVSGSDTIVCDMGGRVVVCSDPVSTCSHRGLQLNQDYLDKVISQGSDQGVGIIRNVYADQRYVVSVPILDAVTDKPTGIVIVSVATTETTNILNQISNIFLTVATCVVLISVLGVSAFARRESKPLREMAKVANAFAHGDLTARVPEGEDWSEEMEELTIAFNNMATYLQKAEYRRQEFVANVSHELKTPMTVISGYIDGILDGTIPERQQRYYLQIVSDETKRLSRLVRSMLDISQLQTQEGIPDEKKVRFDLEECAGQALLTFEKKINDKKLNVIVDFPEHPVYTFANQDYITQVVFNLLDNAVKFCPEGKDLGISIKENGEKAYVSISNQGDTIPPEELPLVFDRFHKLDKSRSQNRDGWGLGLYIVKTIILSHGENISVTSRDGKTAFTFTMPIVP